MTGIEESPMKVLMTTDTVGGVWTYCMELCGSLPSIQFHLVTFGALMSIGQKREVQALSNVVVYETAFKLEWMDDPWKDIDVSGAWLLKLEEEIQPSLVHLNAFSFGSLPFRAPKIVVAHSDVFSWWLAVIGELPINEWNEYYKRIKVGLDNADLVIAPSQSIMKSICDIYDISTANQVIYNGRNRELFFQDKKRPVIFSMGRLWDEAKNIQLLVNIASEIPWEIRIAGQQHFEKNEMELHSNKVKFLGKLEFSKIAEELSKTSIYVLPAKYEPFGLSALEAAFCGCALILGDIPSLREIWGDDALYVDVNNQDSLLYAIESLLTDHEICSSYQKKALERAKVFSSKVMAGKYKAAYHKLILNKEVFV